MAARHPGGQREPFTIGKHGADSVNSFDQIRGVAPNVQLFVRPLLRIPNSASRIPALHPITNIGSSNSTGWPFSTRMASMVPLVSASI